MIAVLFAGAFGLLFTLVATPGFIKLFIRLRWGQFIRSDGPEHHSVKRGTPTMGGLVIVLAVAAAYLLANLLLGLELAASALLVIFMMAGMGLVGFIDDILKVKNQRSLGLGGWSKIAGQLTVGTVFAVAALLIKDNRGRSQASMAVSFARDTGIDFSSLTHWGIVGVVAAWVLYLFWINLITVSAANGVNLTDGLDGLAGGATVLTMLAYIFISFWQFNQDCARRSLAAENVHRCYEVSNALDLAIVAAAILGALLGFLWWNTNPAQIIMGDTGALALGGAIAAFSVLTHTQLLLAIIGGVFVIETASVIIQRAFYKKFRRRIFLMSPIHHHFELKGWGEVTIVVRFWIIASMFAAFGVGLFYFEWVSL